MNTRRTSNRIVSLTIAALLGVALHLAAQQPSQTAVAAPLPVFDIVSIHENKSGIMMSTVRWGGDAFTATNTTVTFLLMSGYNIREDLISGLPGWAKSFHFDLNAKISDPDIDALKKLTREQRGAMMIALLKDRFHLQAHIETKTLPVYDLVIAKSGSKLKEDTALPSEAPDPGSKTPFNLKPGGFMVSDSQMTGIAIPVSNLVRSLAFQVERNVIDKTGLTGNYDINLKWTPTELQGKSDSTDNAPDIFTALQEQLGLKLEPSKGPVDTLVIDHVEMPSEN